MPILLVFVLALLSFIVGLVGLTIAAISESQRRKQGVVFEVEEAGGGQAFSVMSVADAFEPETAILWETQMPALAYIDSAGPRGLEVEDLRPFYARCARCYPELHEGSDFHAWVEFLQHAELVVLSGSRVAITPAGTEFLKCRVAAGVTAA